MHKLIDYYNKRIVRTKMPTHTHTTEPQAESGCIYIFPRRQL